MNSYPDELEEDLMNGDFEVQGINDNDLFTHFVLFYIVILWLSKMLLKNQSGGRQWMPKLLPLKETTFGS